MEAKEQRLELFELASFFRKQRNRSSKSWAKVFEIGADATRKDNYFGEHLAQAISLGLEKVESKEKAK